MRRFSLLLAAAVGVSLALVQAYSVAPVKASWSGWTSHEAPNNRVSELVTCCWDQLDSASGGYVELFQGDTSGTGTYLLSIREYPGDVAVATSPNTPQGSPHSWLRFSVWMLPGKHFTKGKQYEFRFTRAGTDSINYYYQNDEPYGYGDSKVGNDVIIGRDLCLRVFGVMDPVDSTYWGAELAPSV